MKKDKLVISLSLALCLSLCMTVCAYAQDVWNENIDVYAWHRDNSLNGVTGYGQTDALGPHIGIYNQTTVFDDSYNEEGYGYSSSKNENVNSVSSFAVSKDLFTGGFYSVETFGQITIPSYYGDYISRARDVDAFRYGYTARDAVDVSRYRELHQQYGGALAGYLFEMFDMDPSQYELAIDTDLCMNYGLDGAYLFARETMDRPEKSTLPMFYVNEGRDEVFAVYQDPSAVCYLYDYTLGGDGLWYISDIRQVQDSGRYSEARQSFAEFAAAAAEEDPSLRESEIIAAILEGAAEEASGETSVTH